MTPSNTNRHTAPSSRRALHNAGLSLALFGLAVLFSSCDLIQDSDSGLREQPFDHLSSRDVTRINQLNASLRSAMSAQVQEGGLEFFRLPDSDDFD
ncbi:MAG: hypothetical protein R3178_10410, partial [Rhodothermales bacterium]|nr:hypothetical protein [Rhodothermales bacterium]